MYTEQGNKIKEMRLQKNLQRQELAEKSGLSSVQITNIEKGTNRPKVPTLTKLAKGLDCDVEILFKIYY